MKKVKWNKQEKKRPEKNLNKNQLKEFRFEKVTNILGIISDVALFVLALYLYIVVIKLRLHY